MRMRTYVQKTAQTRVMKGPRMQKNAKTIYVWRKRVIRNEKTVSFAVSTDNTDYGGH